MSCLWGVAEVHVEDVMVRLGPRLVAGRLVREVWVCFDGYG